MVVGIMPAKRHGEWVASGGAAAVDGADGENVGEGRRNRCLKRLIGRHGAHDHWSLTQAVVR